MEPPVAFNDGQKRQKSNSEKLSGSQRRPRVEGKNHGQSRSGEYASKTSSRAPLIGTTRLRFVLGCQNSPSTVLARTWIRRLSSRTSCPW